MNSNYNIYTFIHKYLRQQLCLSVITMGGLDDSDDNEVRDCLHQVSTLLSFCEEHLVHENQFIHAAIKLRNPHMYLTTEAEHREHEAAIRKLQKDTQIAAESFGARRSALLFELYAELSIFLAENLEHMQTEETHNAQLLSDLFSEAEIETIHKNILASIPAEQCLRVTGEMLCALMHSERLSLLQEMQQRMPEGAYITLIEQLKSKLPPRHFSKLLQGLSPMPVNEPQAV